MALVDVGVDPDENVGLVCTEVMMAASEGEEVAISSDVIGIRELVARDVEGFVVKGSSKVSQPRSSRMLFKALQASML